MKFRRLSEGAQLLHVPTPQHHLANRTLRAPEILNRGSIHAPLTETVDIQVIAWLAADLCLRLPGGSGRNPS